MTLTHDKSALGCIALASNVLNLNLGHQHGARGNQVARMDHVACGLPMACSDNSTNMISFFAMMNIFNFYY